MAAGKILSAGDIASLEPLPEWHPENRLSLSVVVFPIEDRYAIETPWSRSNVLQILEVKTKEDLLEIRNLFEEYGGSLEIDLDFQGFDQELVGLPGEYAPPDGCLLIGLWNDQTAGCVALRKFDPHICEMKRLYTKPQFRGLGIGRTLCETVIGKARQMGYQSMRLDTLSSMKTARDLYLSLGFKEIEPYRFNPVEGASFMELTL
jgi:ribosomal protein S18 acetylase RimI-like enzyme